MTVIQRVRRFAAGALLALCVYGPLERFVAAAVSESPLDWSLFSFALIVVALVLFVSYPAIKGT